MTITYIPASPDEYGIAIIGRDPVPCLKIVAWRIMGDGSALPIFAGKSQPADWAVDVGTKWMVRLSAGEVTFSRAENRIAMFAAFKREAGF